MLALQIDNAEIESVFVDKFKSNKKEFIDFIAKNLEQFKSKKNLQYTKKNPMEHIQTISYIDDSENLNDVKPYSHIENSAQYIHDIRRKKDKNAVS